MIKETGLENLDAFTEKGIHYVAMPLGKYPHLATVIVGRVTKPYDGKNSVYRVLQP